MTLTEAIEMLRKGGVDSPEYDARELFRVFGSYSGFVPRDASSDSEELIRAVERRAAREPLQYIIGTVGFYREEYKVTPDCLIPRSDTEELVDYAVKNMPCGARILDLCTGSGCVAIPTLCATKDTTAVAADISSGALKIAEENGKINGVSDRLTLLECDLLKEKIEGEFFAILSNPPYVCNSVYEELEAEIAFEPKNAFVGGIDGGDFYRTFTPMYRDSLVEGGFIAYEIGYDQAELIRSIAKENGMSCEILKDLSGNNRVAVLRK